MQIAVLNGPNIGNLGKRLPEKYGTTTLTDITTDIDATAEHLGVTADHHQSDHEGDLLKVIHGKNEQWHGIVLNPAGLTPTGWSLLDAIRDTRLPFAVVHLSQFLARDGRERSDIFATTATIYLCGAGARSYSLALDAMVHHLRRTKR